MNKYPKDLDGICVRYIYSACIITKTPDVTVLHDPWFTEGIYDGSWFHFPKVENPLESIGDVDCIYISHVHPDHYDSKFLSSYFQKYGIKPIYIADHHPNHLALKMRADGFRPEVLDKKCHIGRTSIEIVPHKTGSIADIDSVAIIKYESIDGKSNCVVNANDVIFDEKIRVDVKKIAGEIDILLCGFTGAGPYPQTYYDQADAQIYVEAEKKKNDFFKRYKKLIEVMAAKVNIPFAGKYLLGGKLANLNYLRGVADPVEIMAIDKNAIILEDNGGQINTVNLCPDGVRTASYIKSDVDKRIREIQHFKMDYERLIDESEIYQLPIKRLLHSAITNAHKKSECDEDYWFCFKLNSDQIIAINANRTALNPVEVFGNDSQLPIPRSEITIDDRYLFGLLTKIYHWNNAEVGSQYIVRRFPNNFNRKAQSFLNYLTV